MSVTRASNDLTSDPMQPVVRRLDALHQISWKEVSLLHAQARSRVRVLAGEPLTHLGAAAPMFLLSGWAAYQRRLGDGRRQILRILLPGDCIGERPHLRPPACETSALTDVSVADAAHVIAAARAGEAPGLARAMSAADQQHELQLINAIVRLGALSAYERMANLLVELADRLAAAGLGDERAFPLPLTQEVLADTLGVSIVHTNRILQQLRADRLIELRSGVAVLLQAGALSRIARGDLAPAPHSVAHSSA
jgi:CRP-like cAMP-binding protein